MQNNAAVETGRASLGGDDRLRSSWVEQVLRHVHRGRTYFGGMGYLRSSEVVACLRRAVPILYMAVAISLPFSMRLYFSGLDLEVIFPAEPLIGLLALVLGVLFMAERAWRSLDVSALRDPLVVLVLAWLGVLAASALGSQFPLVSFKALLVRSAFVLLFFLFPVLVPTMVRVDRRHMLMAHAMAFVAIIVYSSIRQSDMGYDRNGSALAPFPFYVDHTSYAAVIVFAMLLIGSEALISTLRNKGPFALDLVLLFALYAGAFYFAFCRAAWVSLLVVFVLPFIIGLRLRFRSLLVFIAVACVPLSIMTMRIMAGDGAVLADSNATGAGFKESVLSLTNTHTDTSNRERINRWKSALRMFRDAPMLGHGVGAYQFTFLPYQLKEEMTYISVTGPVDPARVQRVWSFSDRVFVRRNPQTLYCSGGTAHSEYFLALSESGLAAGLLFVALALAALRNGMRMVKTAADQVQRIRVFAIWSAVCAYFVHAFFNNYLDDPKVAFMFWTSLGLLVSNTASAAKAS